MKAVKYVSDSLLKCGRSKKLYEVYKEQCMWYDTEQTKLDSLYYEFVKMNNQSEAFYFSNWEKENNDEQNKLMWKYQYLD